MLELNIFGVLNNVGKRLIPMEKIDLTEVENGYIAEIEAIKKQWGDELVILTHHYQRPEIVAQNDFVGDSFQLAAQGRDSQKARFIVFCGVRFMAEAAEILRRDEQVVLHPVAEAGCPLADFAPLEQAEEAWEHIASVRGAGAVMPLVYMNSSAELKALVGHHGGSVCTSSNTARAFEWAFEQRAVVFFFPDQHLGNNTALGLGVDPAQIVRWNPAQPSGGIAAEDLRQARVILWDGYCHVHTAFTPEQIAQARVKHPGARVVVHPECPSAVVAAADGAGSTAYLVKQAASAKPGSTLVIGTEINLIVRLADEHPDLTIVPLHRSLCPNMFRISPKRLLDSLKTLPHPEVIKVPEEVKVDARLALERMLSL
jgi:quinolinate synthase